jgi:phosphorylcholine metabolism protein LicD
MRPATPDWKLMRARFIVKWGAELHRLRIPLTNRVVLPLNVKGLEKSLAEVHDVFTRHRICFWLRDGTALGVVRDGGIIAHDDDVDLGVWPEDLPALEHALRDLEGMGFVVYKHNRWIVGLLKRRETIEIVISGSWTQDDAYHIFVDSFFETLRSVDYLGRQFNVPRDSDAYLEFCYGLDWRTPKPFAWWASSAWLQQKDREEYRRKFITKSSHNSIE